MNSEQSKTYKLYMGGIPVDLDEAQLGDLLRDSLPNFKVHIMRNPEQGNSKGCGFLEVFSKKDFNWLLKNKIFVHGKALQIEEYISNEEERKKRMLESNERSIHVSNLPPEADNKDLESYFATFGKINRAYIIFSLGTNKKSREFGFVEFASKKIAQKVLNQEHKLLGKTITITQRHSKKELMTTKAKDSGSKNTSTHGVSNQSKYQKDKKKIKTGLKNPKQTSSKWKEKDSMSASTKPQNKNRKKKGNQPGQSTQSSHCIKGTSKRTGELQTSESDSEKVFRPGVKHSKQALSETKTKLNRSDANNSRSSQSSYSFSEQFEATGFDHSFNRFENGQSYQQTAKALPSFNNGDTVQGTLSGWTPFGYPSENEGFSQDLSIHASGTTGTSGSNKYDRLAPKKSNEYCRKLGPFGSNLSLFPSGCQELSDQKPYYPPLNIGATTPLNSYQTKSNPSSSRASLQGLDFGYEEPVLQQDQNGSTNWLQLSEQEPEQVTIAEIGQSVPNQLHLAQAFSAQPSIGAGVILTDTKIPDQFSQNQFSSFTALNLPTKEEASMPKVDCVSTINASLIPQNQNPVGGQDLSSKPSEKETFQTSLADPLPEHIVQTLKTIDDSL